MQAAKELHFGFDLKPSDRFCWVSDIGWMMGPWTLIGTHAFGGTMFMYEGAPDHPQPDRFWGDDRPPRPHSVLHLSHGNPRAPQAGRRLGRGPRPPVQSPPPPGSTGEPWDPESWQWFYEYVGGSDTSIINISGGTEIMGCFLMPMPINDLKPCTLGGPGLGMNIDIVNHAGESIADTHERGFLIAHDSCPSMTKSLWSGDERYLEEYWSSFEDPPL